MPLDLCYKKYLIIPKHKITMPTAVILAGGRGERLRPLTDSIPKPMIRIKGKPFLQYQLELLSKYNIADIILCVGFLHDTIIDYFGDGSGQNVSIRYSIEDIFLGTGGALKYAQEHLPQDFLLLYGDSYLPIDYTRLLESWYASGAQGLVVCYDNALGIDRNNVRLDPDGLIRSYNKRAPAEGANYLEAGASVLKKDILELIPSGKPVSLEEEIFPLLIKAGLLHGYPTPQRYYDIGTPERLKQIEGALT